MKKLARLSFLLGVLFWAPQASAACPGTIQVIDYQGNPLEGITLSCDDCQPPSQCTSDASGNCAIDFGQTCLWPCAYHLSSSNPDCVFLDHGYSVDCSDPGAPPTFSVICEPWDGTPPPGPPPGPPGPPGELACGDSDASGWKIRTSWPDKKCCDLFGNPEIDCPKNICECKFCNQTNYLTPDCAQSFIIHHPLSGLKRNDCEYQCPEDSGEWYLVKHFDGQVFVDASATKVPFVGKNKEKIDADVDTEGREDELYYLADYFEGTHEYYRDYPLLNVYLPLPVGGVRLRAHGINITEQTNYQGAMRKLTPYEFQNQVKRNMVARAQLSNANMITYGKIHDYNVRYLERLCWNAPFYLEAFVAVAGQLGFDPLDAWRVLDFCMYNANAMPDEHAFMEMIERLVNAIPGMDKNENIWEYEKVDAKLSELVPPPSPFDFETANEYQKAWQDWAGPKEDRSENWRLWQAAPLVTREDTQGHIYPEPELRDHVDEYWKGPWDKPIKIPHLARLWETSRWIQQTLIPAKKDFERTSELPLLAKYETKTSFAAAANPNLLGSATASTKSPLSSVDTGCGQPAVSTPSVLGQKVLLAQTGSGCFHLDASAIYNEPNVDVTIYFISDGGDGDTWLWKSGQMCAHNQWNLNIHGPVFTYYPQWTCEPTVVNRGECKSFTWVGMVSNSENCQNARDTITCNFCVDMNGILTSNCNTSPSLPPFPPPPACNLPEVPWSDECLKEAVVDPHLNDTICTNRMKGEVFGIEEVKNPYCEYSPDTGAPDGCACKNVSDCNPVLRLIDPCVDFCCKSLSAEAQRQIELYTDIPYLNETWEQTTVVSQGFFNIFRPHGVLPFKDAYAKGTINYDYSAPNGAYASPSTGDFYYPHLGGIQMSKEWVIKALTPYVE